jgi:molybdenum-dependent DNA-binding transcriptional regulator ModE
VDRLGSVEGSVASAARRLGVSWRTVWSAVEAAAEEVASVATGTHNGRTEAANAKIKDVKRSARGFTNLHNYRLRILLAAGRTPGQTQPVTKIRTRRPRFVA